MEVKQKVWESLSKEVEMPEGVTAVVSGDDLTVKGPKGEVMKNFRYPRVNTKVEGNKIVFSTDRLTQREKKIIFTYNAHAKNLVRGVTEGFTYKLKVVYAKFPMTVTVAGNKLVVKNFLGEKVPREALIINGTNVVVSGADITVTGIDKEKCGQVAASIEQSTRITHFDRRVIQDGIYITEKPHVRYS